MEIINLGSMAPIERNKWRLGQLVMRHKGEELWWNASNYDQPSFTEPESLFFHLNLYWANLPVTRQDQIFDLYKKAHEALSTVENLDRLMTRLTQIVTELYVQQPKQELTRFIAVRNNVCLPSTLPDHYGQNPEERTYLRDHYRGLTVLVLALRAMVPIWAEFIRTVRGDAVERKEILAMRLIVRSWMMGHTNDDGDLIPDPDMEKLRRMVYALATNSDTPLVAVIQSVGSEQFPEWLYAMAVIRRAAIGELSQTNTQINVVSTIYKTVVTAVDKGGKNFSGGDIYDKNHRPPQDEDNSSLAEAYKPRQEVSPGDILVYSVYADRLERLAKDVDPTIDEGKLKLCFDALSAAQQMGGLARSEHQRLLVMWTLSSVVPANSISYMEPSALFNSMVATQALLWHWGFPNLAVFVSVGQRPRSDRQLSEHMEFRSRTSSTNLQKLNEIYPYYRPTGRASERKNMDNFGTQAIDKFNELLSSHSWVNYAPDELVAASSAKVIEDVLMIPSTIRNDLAEYLVHLYQRA